MKKSIELVVVGLFLILGMGSISAHEGSGEPESPVSMYVWGLVGPHTSNPVYANWASNQVWKIYTTGSPEDALGYRLNPVDVTQPTSLVSNSLWFAVRVVCHDHSFQFSPADLMFTGMSSDMSNGLGKTNYFNNPTYVYSKWAYGIIHDVAGPRVADTIIADGSYWGSTNINEFIFIGAMSKYFTYSSLAQQSNIVATLNSMPEFFTTGTWSLSHDGHTWRAMKTLRLKGDPFAGILSIANQPGMQVRVGLNAGTNDTWVIQHTDSVQYPNWHDMWTANANDTFVHDNLSPDTGFWRARLQ